MRVPKLSSEEITQRLETVPGWALENDELTRTFTFADFVAAMRFVNAVADAAEAADHHPDIDIRYNKVRLALTTHDSGGITENDFNMAAKASTLA